MDMPMYPTEPERFFAHPYQTECFQTVRDYLLREDTQRAGIISPTGSGKSVMVQLVVQGFLNTKQGRGAIVAVPQVQIQGGFLPEKQGTLIHLRQQEMNHPEGLLISSDKWMNLEAIEGEPLRRKEKLAHHLRTESKRVYLLTHQAMMAWTKDSDFLPKSLKGQLLVLDESHHTSNTGGVLGTVVHAWIKRGGKVLFVTATPFRKNGEKISLEEDDPRYFRSMALHCHEGFAPESFRVEMSRLTSVESTRFNIKHLRDKSQCEEIVKLWINDKRPKTVIAVPQSRALEWVNGLFAAFVAAGVPRGRIFNSYGDSKKEALQELLDAERKLTAYDDSQCDIILSCQRFNEGSDWKFCSHFYNIGLTDSPVLALQRLGRTMRDKRKLVPYQLPENKDREAYQNLSVMRFIIPGKLSDEHWQRYVQSHLDTAHLLATYMADPETGLQYQAQLRLRLEDIGRQRSGGKQDEDTLWNKLVNALGEDRETCRTYAAPLAGALSVLERDFKKPNPTPKEVGDILRKTNHPEEVVNGAMRLYDHQTFEQLPRAIQTQITEHLHDKVKSGKIKDTKNFRRTIERALIEAFDTIVKEYPGTHLGQMTYVSEFTGIGSENLAKLLRTRLTSAWEENYLMACAYFEEHGHTFFDPNDPDPYLYEWSRVQRSEYNKGRLSPDKIEKLLALKMLQGEEDNPEDMLFDLLQGAKEDPSWIVAHGNTTPMERFVFRLRNLPATHKHRQKMEQEAPWFIMDPKVASFALKIQACKNAPDTLKQGSANYRKYLEEHLKYHLGKLHSKYHQHMDLDFDREFREAYEEEWHAYQMKAIHVDLSTARMLVHEWVDAIDLHRRVTEDQLLDFERQILFSEGSTFGALVLWDLLRHKEVMEARLKQQRHQNYRPDSLLGFYRAHHLNGPAHGTKTASSEGVLC